MRNTFSSLSLLAFGSFLLMLPGLIALKKTSTPPLKPSCREQLANKWAIQSFTIDGVEVKGKVIKSSTLQFGDHQGLNGNFNWTLHYRDDTSEHQSGTYTLVDDDRKMDMENQKHEHFQFEVVLGKNELRLTGILEGEHYILKAKRDWK